MDKGKNSLDMLQHFSGNKAFECTDDAAHRSPHQTRAEPLSAVSAGVLKAYDGV